MKLGRTLLVSTWLVGLSGCGVSAPPAQKSPAPAKVAKPVQETDLATVTLTPEAEKRLAIRLVQVERRAVARTRTFGGQLVVPPGRSATVSAPLAGTLAAGATPRAGQSVKRGENVFALQPLLTPPDRVRLAEMLVTLAASRVEAEGQVEKARVQVESSRVMLARAEQLVRDKAGSVKGVDEARAQLDLAEAALKAAEASRDLLAQSTLDSAAQSQQPIAIPSPEDGMVEQVHALAGQVVSAGSPLFQVARHDILWVRVPVYVGYLSSIALDEAARVSELSESAGKGRWERVVQPVAAPPSADPALATVDLFYEFDNSDLSQRPGQRLGVTLRLSGDAENLVVPESSVLHDIYGSAWVYESVAPHTFVRRRVQVRYTVDSMAVLAGGLSEGLSIVADGAVELFGTEMGFAK